MRYCSNMHKLLKSCNSFYFNILSFTGQVDPAEAPEQTAVRELKDEAGYMNATVKHSSPCKCNQYADYELHIYFHFFK